MNESSLTSAVNVRYFGVASSVIIGGRASRPMAKQIKALVKPAVLKWARESLNLALPDAAKKIGVKAVKLSDWESGASSPTIGQLRKAASVYKRPLAVFFLSDPPRDFDALRDFRRLPDPTKAAPSPKLNLEIRRAQMRRETAVELPKDSVWSRIGCEQSVLIQVTQIVLPTRLGKFLA